MKHLYQAKKYGELVLRMDDYEIRDLKDVMENTGFQNVETVETDGIASGVQFEFMGNECVLSLLQVARVTPDEVKALSKHLPRELSERKNVELIQHTFSDDPYDDIQSAIVLIVNYVQTAGEEEKNQFEQRKATAILKAVRRKVVQMITGWVPEEDSETFSRLTFNADYYGQNTGLKPQGMAQSITQELLGGNAEKTEEEEGEVKDKV